MNQMEKKDQGNQSEKVAVRAEQIVQDYNPEFAKKLKNQYLFLKKRFGPELEDEEFIQYLVIFAKQNLDPFTNEVSLVSYRGKDGALKTQIIVGKNFHLRVAQSIPTYQGFKAGVIAINDNGEVSYREGSFALSSEAIVGGWAEIHDSARSFPHRIEVMINEYNQNNKMWSEKPATMIRKVAIVQALRETYVAQLQGFYAAEEMPPTNSPTESNEEDFSDFMPKSRNQEIKSLNSGK